MDESQFIGFRAFMGSGDVEFQKASTTFIKICNTVIRGARLKHESLRRVSLNDEDFHERILPVPGVLEALFEMGFEEDPSSNEYLMFPTDRSTDLAKAFRRKVQARIIRDKLKAEVQVISSDSKIETLSTGSTLRSMNSFPRIHSKSQQANIRSTLLSMSKQSQRYEDPELHSKIKTVVPIQRLINSAKEICARGGSKTNSGDEKTSSEAVLRSVFLFVLLKWFKEEFFHWVNNLQCQFCNSDQTEPLRITLDTQHFAQPTTEEARHGTSRIELFLCKTCHKVTRFPRYNDPAKLLDTRKGRCGEWANCFTAICRAMGFEARHVTDSADHVWTEVFSELDDRWMHCDSCEMALDKPLIYETGWGKKLTYVFAVSSDEIVDVSWRYSASHAELMNRRREIDEKWLRRTISAANKMLQKNLPVERRNILQRRKLRELIEFLVPRVATDAEKVGRSSGDLWWRLSRGELRVNEVKSFIITPSAEEIERMRLCLSYNAGTDFYIRGEAKIAGLAEFTYSSRNVIRKVETDWKMAYLARQPGSSDGDISWKFDCVGTGLVIRKMKISTPRASFQSGIVTVSITVDDELLTDEAPELFTYEAGDSHKKCVVVRAFFRGGDGENAWQHAQLFRESLTGLLSPFVVEIDFQ